jgi:Ca-activated chloride channel family protein
MPADFHFLNPAWLLALLPLGALLAALTRARQGAGAWRRVVEPQLLAALIVGSEGRPRRWPLMLLGLGWLLAVLALANPTFERVPVPAFRDAAARVVALDLSQSMLADDLAPSRLTRARFKVEDILNRSRNGQVGLVAFAGDAFAVAPLTDDAETIRNMLPALSPEIMPAEGSRPDLAIQEALRLLRQAGVQDGEVVLLTDDAGGARARSAAADLRRAGHRLAVIGVGTPEGAAVPGVRTSRGAVIAQLAEGELRSLARHGGGDYARITVDDADLRRALARDESGRVREDEQPMQADVWKELGPWVALALVPLAALGFRRGWLLLPALLALGLSGLAPAPVLAQGDAGDTPALQGLGERWRALWQRPDQQAAGALAGGDYARAVRLAQDPARSGAARYRLGDFEAAADAFAAGDSADAHYNRGNALARAGRLEDALEAYDVALSQAPGMADAQYNRERVAEALRRREQQSQQQQSPQADAEQQSNGQSGDQSGAGGSRDDARQGDAGGGGQAQQADAADAADQGESGSEQAGAAGESPDSGGREPGSEAAQPDAGAGEGSEQPPGAAADAGAEQQAAAAQQDGAGGGQDEEPEQVSAAEAAQRRASEDQAAADYQAEAQAEADAGSEPATGIGAAGGEQTSAGDRAAAGGDALPDPAQLESRQAADQWLRRIPDDPAGLLRRKFLYQYRMRAGDGRSQMTEDPW